jgi:hypothetical protein
MGSGWAVLQTAEAVAHLDRIADQEFALYTDLAAGWIAVRHMQRRKWRILSFSNKGREPLDKPVV